MANSAPPPAGGGRDKLLEKQGRNKMIQNKEIFIKNPFSAHISIHLIDYSIVKLQNSIIFDDLSHIYLFFLKVVVRSA